MKRNLYTLLLILSALLGACASGPGSRENAADASSDGANISARGAIGGLGLESSDALSFEGDGGKDISLAIIAPHTQGDVPGYLPLYVQGLLNNNFGKYSAITLIDRQNLDMIISEHKIAASGYYSDADFITIGNLTNSRYFLFGTIQRLSGNRYSLQLSITEAGTGIRKANSMMDGTLAQLEGTGSLINDASADLLVQMGVRLSAAGRQALLAGNTTMARAQAAQAQGIIAQAGGSEVEALLNFSQSVAFDPSQMEALSRLSSLSSTISSGSIGERIVGDIQARNQWIEAFKETANFFSNHPPFEIIFDPNLVQIGNTDYARGTANLGMRIALNPSEAGFGALNALLEGLNKTGRRSIWGFEGWPLQDIDPKIPGTVVFNGSKSFTYKVDVVLLNEMNKTLGKNTVTMDTRNIAFSAGSQRVTPPSGTVETVLFPNVNAAELTPILTIVITAVNGIPTRDISASGYMRIDTGDLEKKALAAEQQRAETAQVTAIKTQVALEKSKAQNQAASAAFMNVFLGAGSFFIQNDSMGGLMIFALQGGGAAMVIGGYMNREKQGQVYTDKDGKEQKRNPKLLFGMGWGVYGAGVLLGFIEPFIFNTPRAFFTANPPPLDIGLVSDTNGNAAVQLSYTKRF